MGFLGSIVSSEDSDREMESADISSRRASWSRGPLLGRGSFGRVNIGVDSASGELIAVKSVRVTEETSHELRALENEYEILQQLDSPSVIKCFGADWSTEDGVPTRNLLLALASGGSLADSASSTARGSGSCEAEVSRHVRGVVEGLSYIHAHGVVHCDLKARNVVLSDSRVVLVDFGLSIRRRSVAEIQEASSDCDTERKETLRGTPCWMAPEVVAGGDIGPACDIWSLGCTVIELLTGKPPWSSQCADPVSVLYKLRRTNEIPAIPDDLSPTCNDFICRCLIRDPQQRPSAAELLSHPFLQGQRSNADATTSSPSLASSSTHTEAVIRSRLHGDIDMASSSMAHETDDGLTLNLASCKMDELCALFPPTPSPRLISPLHVVAQQWGSLTRPSHRPAPNTTIYRASSSKVERQERIPSGCRPSIRPCISVPAPDCSSLDYPASPMENTWTAPSPAQRQGCTNLELSPPELDPISPDIQEAGGWHAWDGERQQRFCDC